MNFYEALLHYVSGQSATEWGRGECRVQSADCIAAPVGAKKLSKLGVRAPLCCQVLSRSLHPLYPPSPLPPLSRPQGTTRKLHVLLDSNALEMIMANQVQFLLSL